MKKSTEIALVVPCYNEASRGQFTKNSFYNRLSKLNQLLDHKKVPHVVFVSDGSKDATAIEIDLFIKTHGLESKWHLIDNKVNKGKGGALIDGLNYASSLAPFVGYIDADLSVDVSYLNKQAIPCTRYCIYGNRIYEKEQSFPRKCLSHLSKIAVKMLTNLKVKDTQCPYKVFSSKKWKEVQGNLKGYRWIFDIELLYYLQKAKVVMKKENVKFNNMEESTLSSLSALKRCAIDLIDFKLMQIKNT